jgi:hypothetical protein
MQELATALRPLFISSGYPPEQADRFIVESRKELQQLKVHSYAKLHYAWATRAVADWR